MGKFYWMAVTCIAYPQEQVRRQIGCLSQRTWFFNDTLRYNLLLARPGATDAEIQAATQRAQIHDFISGLPKGYETVIGERGYRLSGANASAWRLPAFVAGCAHILLDEPTANLDPLTGVPHPRHTLFAGACHSLPVHHPPAGRIGKYG